jgi:hypothetical protein
MRRELGRQLAVQRKAAGLVQRELGRMAGYSRTAIANAETGAAVTSRRLWQGADQALGTGDLFTRGHDRIQAHMCAEAQARAEKLVSAAGRGDGGLATVTARRAPQAYQDRGWPVHHRLGGRLWLVTGTVIDALEVPQLAGMVAVGWWLYTRGVPDPIRGLPALPDPAGALAVISTGTRCYFLVRSGACPWTSHDTQTDRKVDAAVVRWHAHGGRVPAPPSPLQDGELARWVHAPSQGGLLASPMALLHLLAQATATTGNGTELILPGGVRAVPATSTVPPVRGSQPSS